MPGHSYDALGQLELGAIPPIGYSTMKNGLVYATAQNIRAITDLQYTTSLTLLDQARELCVQQ